MKIINHPPDQVAISDTKSEGTRRTIFFEEKNQMMPVTIITGRQNSGKTAKALELVKGKTFLFVKSPSSYELIQFEGWEEPGVVIILDEVDKHSMKTIKQLITSKSIAIKDLSGSQKIFPRPELIITTHAFKQKDFRQRPYLKFIEL